MTVEPTRQQTSPVKAMKRITMALVALMVLGVLAVLVEIAMNGITIG